MIIALPTLGQMARTPAAQRNKSHPHLFSSRNGGNKMKRFMSALIGATLITGGAYAQSISVGPGGIGVDTRGPRDRVIEREVRRDGYDRRDDRRRVEYRNRERCRTVITREETRRGVVKTRQRVCD